MHRVDIFAVGHQLVDKASHDLIEIFVVDYPAVAPFQSLARLIEHIACKILVHRSLEFEGILIVVYSVNPVEGIFYPDKRLVGVFFGVQCIYRFPQKYHIVHRGLIREQHIVLPV